MSMATRKALWAIIVASQLIVALSLLLWVDWHTLQVIGYATSMQNEWLLAGLAIACGVFSWYMLFDPNELTWSLLVVAGGTLFVVAASANLSYESPGCRDVLSFFSFGCFERTGLGTAALWWITICGFIVATLALAMPVIELWDRTRVAQND